MDTLTAKSLFIYATVVCLSIAYFRHFTVSSGIWMGLLIAGIIVFILYEYTKSELLTDKYLHETKLNNIYPHMTYVNQYDDIVDFVFSVQDFYIYNPQSFEDMTQAIDDFFEMYGDILLDYSLSNKLYNSMVLRKKGALNALQSLIITTPANKKVTDKLNRSLYSLETILNKYLLSVYDKNKQHIKENGYFNDTIPIILHPAASNEYSKDDYEQFY